MPDKTYLQVILPLKLDWEPWYYALAGSDGAVVVGNRVSVRFGPRSYVAVVSRVSAKPDIPEDKVLRITRVERGLPPVGEWEMKLWRFMADYYMCTVGEVYHQAYPVSRIDREQAGARAESRRLRAKEQLMMRIGRLQERLDKKNLALQGRHGEKVRQELSEARDRIAAEISELNARLAALDRDDAPEAVMPGPAGLPSGLAMRVGECLAARRTVLLETSDPGIYAQLISETLAAGRQALLLVPEIMLAERMKSVTGLLTFNSSISDVARREIAERLRSGEPLAVIGTRSAIFLPFNGLDLVIVDNEHDSSFKQDAAPRYNARDMAAVLAGLHGAGLLLASACPSLESIYNCMGGRYERISVEDKAAARPRMMLIDTDSERRKNGMSGCLSRKLIAEVVRVLNGGGRAMILRSWGRTDFVENDVRTVFPDRIVGSTDNPDADIIVGTMSEAKYLDIRNLRLMCIMHPDKLTARQNFRADEYALQMLESFRSRLGGDGDAVFVIQTSQASHPVYQALAGGEDLSARLMDERRDFGYPPFSRLIDFVLRGRNAAVLEDIAARLVMTLQRALPGTDIQGPMPPEYEKPQGGQLRKVRVALPKDRMLQESKAVLADAAMRFFHDNPCDMHIDVDPL